MFTSEKQLPILFPFTVFCGEGEAVTSRRCQPVVFRCGSMRRTNWSFGISIDELPR